MSYTDAKDHFFGETMTFCRFLLNPATIPAQITAFLAGFAAYVTAPGQALVNNIQNSVISYRADYDTRVALARRVLNDALSWIGEELESEYVNDGAVTNESGILFDLRARMVADGDYVTALAVSPAADPAAANGISLRRLTVDYLGQNIEGGVHSETVTAEVITSALTGGGVGRSQIRLKGSDGPEDTLDFEDKGTARSADIDLEFYGDNFPGLIPNSTFDVSGSPVAGATVDSTNLSQWEQSDVLGTPVTVFNDTLPWRNKTGHIRLTGLNTTKRYQQDFVMGSDASSYIPVDQNLVVRRDATWTGFITVTIGSTTQIFDETDLTTDVWGSLQLTLDKDLYAVNLDDGDSKFRIDINTTHATGTLDLTYSDSQIMTARQGYWYSSWNIETNPTTGAAKSWADTVTYAGVNAATLAAAFGQEPFAWLPTSGSALIPDV